MLLKRDRFIYDKELSEWQEWHRQNPGKDDWRSRKPSKGQIMLIERITDDRSVEVPPLLNRGEAHDWIEQHGGNPRLAPNAPVVSPQGSA